MRRAQDLDGGRRAQRFRLLGVHADPRAQRRPARIRWFVLGRLGTAQSGLACVPRRRRVRRAGASIAARRVRRKPPVRAQRSAHLSPAAVLVRRHPPSRRRTAHRGCVAQPVGSRRLARRARRDSRAHRHAVVAAPCAGRRSRVAPRQPRVRRLRRLAGELGSRRRADGARAGHSLAAALDAGGGGIGRTGCSVAAASRQGRRAGRSRGVALDEIDVRNPLPQGARRNARQRRRGDRLDSRRVGRGGNGVWSSGAHQHPLGQTQSRVARGGGRARRGDRRARSTDRVVESSGARPGRGSRLAGILAEQQRRADRRVGSRRRRTRRTHRSPGPRRGRTRWPSHRRHRNRARARPPVGGVAKRHRRARREHRCPRRAHRRRIDRARRHG